MGEEGGTEAGKLPGVLEQHLLAHVAPHHLAQGVRVTNAPSDTPSHTPTPASWDAATPREMVGGLAVAQGADRVGGAGSTGGVVGDGGVVPLVGAGEEVEAVGRGGDLVEVLKQQQLQVANGPGAPLSPFVAPSLCCSLPLQPLAVGQAPPYSAPPYAPAYSAPAYSAKAPPYSANFKDVMAMVRAGCACEFVCVWRRLRAECVVRVVPEGLSRVSPLVSLSIYIYISIYLYIYLYIYIYIYVYIYIYMYICIHIHTCIYVSCPSWHGVPT